MVGCMQSSWPCGTNKEVQPTNEGGAKLQASRSFLRATMTAKMEERLRNKSIATGRSFRRLVGKARSPVQWRKSAHQLNLTLEEGIRVMTNLDARAKVSDVLHRSASVAAF